MAEVIAGIKIPDSKLAREASDLLRQHGTPLLFAHSLRVFLFGAIRGKQRGLTVDHELLYFGAVFHDLGLTPKYRSANHRFEIDSANSARDFLRANGIGRVVLCGVSTNGVVHSGAREAHDRDYAVVIAELPNTVVGFLTRTI